MPLNDVISLNVGGVSMATSRATLLSDPTSSLAKMFQEDSEIPPAKLKDGEFFLDLDPKCFEVIHRSIKVGKQYIEEQTCVFTGCIDLATPSRACGATLSDTGRCGSGG